MFGQTPRSDFHILENLAAQGIIYEEDIPEDIPVPGTDENLDGDRASDDNLDGASNVLGPDDNPDDVLAVPSTSSRGADMIHTDVDLPEVSDDPVSELRNTGIPEVQQKKRGREYLLLKEDVIVASGHEVPGQTNLDGININLEAQAIVAVDEIHEDAELHENQHVVWDRDQLIEKCNISKPFFCRPKQFRGSVSCTSIQGNNQLAGQ